MSTDGPEAVEPDDLGEYVPAIYARSVSEADRYRQLLEDHDIPAIVDEDYASDTPDQPSAIIEGVPIVVPESLLDDARAFIAEIDEMDTLVEDEDEDDSYDDDEDYALPGVDEKADILLEDEADLAHEADDEDHSAGSVEREQR